MATGPDYAEWDLECELVFDRVLEATDLDLLQVLLVELAPRWSTKLRLWRGPGNEQPIDLERPDSLRNAVLIAAAETGPTYQRLIDLYGRPEDERLVGSAKLRGASPELFVIISIDEIVLSQMGNKKLLGNDISLHIRRPTVEQQPGFLWLADAFQSLCKNLHPAWGRASQETEYTAKVMSASPRIEAIGRDFAKYLPGLFWLNYFGRRYQDLIGGDLLQSAPAMRTTATEEGIFITLAEYPGKWCAPEYVVIEQRVLGHLGREHFFAKPKSGGQAMKSGIQMLKAWLLPPTDRGAEPK